ncbi:MAG: glucose-6-phosphate isomerase [Clostridiales bacterium]|nr:glucose-6-phosphate isomerase [Clostridiales bacterium]
MDTQWISSPKVSPEHLDKARAAWEMLMSRPAAYQDSLGWLSLEDSAIDCLRDIKEFAAEIRQEADALVVIGVGGSNQAARGVIEAMGARGIQIHWAGNTLSPHALGQLLKALEGQRYYMQVIAKNFETLEPGATWRVLRQEMQKRFGREAAARQTILTGTLSSRLHEMAKEQGMRFLPFPGPVGGRFSAFTPVALLALATAGLDVDAYLQGFLRAMKEMGEGQGFALPYAAWRYGCCLKGVQVEMLCAFEPRLERLARWWRQLFGESEGKEGKGIFPSYAIYSEDLHAIGQYVQEGSRILAETFITVTDPGVDVPVPEDRASRDGFDYLEGMGFAGINQKAEEASIAAHRQVLPVFQIALPKIDEENIGWLYAQFMAACAVSARLIDVNPFNQEGVEDYKRRMFAALGR